MGMKRKILVMAICISVLVCIVTCTKSSNLTEEKGDSNQTVDFKEDTTDIENRENRESDIDNQEEIDNSDIEVQDEVDESEYPQTKRGRKKLFKEYSKYGKEAIKNNDSATFRNLWENSIDFSFFLINPDNCFKDVEKIKALIEIGAILSEAPLDYMRSIYLMEYDMTNEELECYNKMGDSILNIVEYVYVNQNVDNELIDQGIMLEDKIVNKYFQDIQANWQMLQQLGANR